MLVTISMFLPTILFWETQNVENMEASLEGWAGGWVAFDFIFSSVKLRAKEGTLAFQTGKLLTKKNEEKLSRPSAVLSLFSALGKN